MRRRFVLLFLVILFSAHAAGADTIHLKNGSILKGKVNSFADDQFVIMLDTGSGRYMSRALVYIGDVARIEFDSATTAANADASTPATTESTDPAPQIKSETAQIKSDPPEIKSEAPRIKTETPSPKSKKGKSTASEQLQPKTDPPVREASPPETQPPPDSTSEKSVSTNPISTTEKPVAVPSETSDSGERVTRKPAPIKSMTVDVIAKKDWTSSGLIVKRGDHIRITASGTITLDPTSGRTTGPEGVSDLTDPKKLMPDQPTGALIGVISSDNDDFIFIGKSGEFTATRDGLLFLSVNEGQLSDNLGSFRATVEVLSQRK